MATKSLNGTVTLFQFVGILIPALVALGMAMSFVVDSKVQAHSAIPYHPGVKDIIYEREKGVALDGKVNGLEGRLDRIEQDIAEIKQLLKEQQRRSQ